jgi:CAAX protease family protein
MKPCIARHPLLSFTLLAYACSWGIAVPLALQAQYVIPSRLPLSLHYLTAFGPAVAAWVTSRALGRSLGSGSGIGSRRLLWLAVGGLSPLALFWAAQLAGLSIGRPVPRWTDLGQVNFLPDLGLAAWLLWLVTSGVGEEVGWRGFALPHLQRTHGALASSTLLAVIWAGWHVPAFFYVPSYTAIGLRIVPGFFFGVLCGSIALAWLYNMSGGSVLAVVLWHASFNYVTASPAASGFVAAVVSTSVIVWAGLIVWWFDSATLTQKRTRSIRPTTRERVRQLPGDDLIAP